MPEFRMPSLGADMTEGTLTRWLVKPGDRVQRGDIVAEVETDKADMEVEIFEAGLVEELVVPEGETVPVGAVLALIAASTTTATAPSPELAPASREQAGGIPSLIAAPSPPSRPVRRATPTARVLANQLGVDIETLTGTGIEGTITRADVQRATRRQAAAVAQRAAPRPGPHISPRARRLARERGIDIDSVTGTGPEGSVVAADLDAAGARATRLSPEPRRPAAPAGEARRGPIIALMERSNREIPHYFLGLDINMEKALGWLKLKNQKLPVPERLLYSVLLLKATALAARDVPELNGHFVGGVVRKSEDVNLGVAISLRQGGLVAPAILDASSKSVSELMSSLQDLVKRARTGRLRASEMSSGSLTVTNLGDLGVDFVYGVIYPPQVALVGFGRVRERPWAEQGMLGVKPVITATLAADHRVSDGHRGGLFLATIDRLLQEPEKL